MKKSIFTICSKNYIAQATTLMDSIRNYEPEVFRYIVIVDRKTRNFELDPKIAEIIWVEDLCIEEFEFKALIFDVLELNTNIKPTAIKHILKYSDICVYLDPDIALFSSLQSVWVGLKKANVVLTPHVIEPDLSVGLDAQRDLLRHGGFNLGFIGVSRSDETDRFLGWWENLCLKYGYQAPEDGFFVDQKFIDHAYIYFDKVVVLRGKGLNVAYWNLHERELKLSESGVWMVQNEMLEFMHFSGFIFSPHNVSESNKVSKYPCRTTLDERPELKVLFDDYRKKLKENHHAKNCKIEYSFGRFDSGVRIGKLARRLLAVGAIKIEDRNRPCSTSGEVFKALDKFKLIDLSLNQSDDRGHQNKSKDRFLLLIGEKTLRFLFQIIGVSRYEKLIKFMNYAGSTFNHKYIFKIEDRKT